MGYTTIRVLYWLALPPDRLEGRAAGVDGHQLLKRSPRLACCLWICTGV